MQDLAPPPATLLDATGAPQKGAYAGRIASAEFKGARLGGWRKKAWRYAGVFRDDLAIGAAIADLGYLGLTFVYVAEGGRFYECAWKSPAAAGMRVGAADGTSVALAPGRTVTLATTRTGGVTVSLALPGIRADLDIEGGTTPLTVVSDVGGVTGRTGMTVKSAGLLTRGTLCVQGRSYTLDDARACLDFTQALFPRRTVWSWATAGGIAADGRPVGFNLARGVHDDAHGRFSENALWLDGTPAALPAVTFTAAPGATPWTIRSADGAVDLSFQPRGERAEDVNFLILSSRYRQPFGSFTGRLRDARGREVRVEGLPGVTEDHAALW